MSEIIALGRLAYWATFDKQITALVIQNKLGNPVWGLDTKDGRAWSRRIRKMRGKAVRLHLEVLG